MGAILHFLLGDRRGGGVAGGLREGFANVRTARQLEGTRQHELDKIAAQEAGAMARTRVTAGATIGSAQIRAAATAATARATQTRADATALATKNHRELTQKNWKVTNNIILKGSKGREILFPKIADEENQDRLLRHLALLKDMPNEEFKEHMNDPVMARQIRSKMASDYYGLAKALETTSDLGKITESLVPGEYLPRILSSNIDSMFNDEFMKIQQGAFTKKDRDPATRAMLLANGKPVMVKIPEAELPMVRDAMINYDGTHVKSKGNTFPELLKSAISSGLPEYSEHSKHMYEFGANPNIKAILNDTAGDAEIRAAKDFIFSNPNFFDKETGLNKEALNKAIDFWAPKKSIRPDVTHFRSGRELEGYRDRLDPKAHQDFQKLAVEASEGVPLAKAALGNLNRLTEAVKEARTGSNISGSLAKLLTLPETVSELASFATNYNRKGHIFSSDRIMDTEGGRELRKQMEEAMSQATNPRADAAIRAQSLELILAYQITAILQGGTGGRTISDTDVKYARTLFSTRTDSLSQRMGRLNNVRLMLNGYLNRGSFWDRYRGKDPLSKDHFRAVKNFDAFLQMPGIRNADGSYKSLEDSLKTLGSKTKLTGGAEHFERIDNAIQRLTNLRAVHPDRIGSFTRSVFENWIATTKTMTGKERIGKPFKSVSLVQYKPNPDRPEEGTLIVVDRRSLYAMDAAKDLENAAKTASTQAFDITNNKPVKIKWSTHEKASFDIDYGDQVEPASVEPAATLEPGAKPTAWNPVHDKDNKTFGAVKYTLADDKFTDYYNFTGFGGKRRINSIDDVYTHLDPKKEFTEIAHLVLKQAGKLETSNNENEMGIKAKWRGGGKPRETNAGWMQWRGTRLRHYIEFANENGLPIDTVDTGFKFLVEELTNGERYGAEEGAPGQRYDKLLEAMKGGNNPETGKPYTQDELFAFFDSRYLRSARTSKPKSALNKDTIKKKVIKGGGVTLKQVGN